MTIHERKQAVSGQMELFERSFTTEEQEMTKVWRKNEWEKSFKTKDGKLIDFRPPRYSKDHRFKLFVRRLYDSNKSTKIFSVILEKTMVSYTKSTQSRSG